MRLGEVIGALHRFHSALGPGAQKVHFVSLRHVVGLLHLEVMLHRGAIQTSLSSRLKPQTVPNPKTAGGKHRREEKSIDWDLQILEVPRWHQAWRRCLESRRYQKHEKPNGRATIVYRGASPAKH